MADINKIVLPGSSTQHTIVADKLYSLSESFTQVESTTAEISHPVGSYLMLNNRLCRVISPIARGDTIEPRYSMPDPRNVELVHLYDDVMPKLVEVTQAQYDALSSSEKERSDVAYMITDTQDTTESLVTSLLTSLQSWTDITSQCTALVSGTSIINSGNFSSRIMYNAMLKEIKGILRITGSVGNQSQIVQIPFNARHTCVVGVGAHRRVETSKLTDINLRSVAGSNKLISSHQVDTSVADPTYMFDMFIE